MSYSKYIDWTLNNPDAGHKCVLVAHLWPSWAVPEHRYRCKMSRREAELSLLRGGLLIYKTHGREYTTLFRIILTKNRGIYPPVANSHCQTV